MSYAENYGRCEDKRLKDWSKIKTLKLMYMFTGYTFF